MSGNEWRSTYGARAAFARQRNACKAAYLYELARSDQPVSSASLPSDERLCSLLTARAWVDAHLQERGTFCKRREFVTRGGVHAAAASALDALPASTFSPAGAHGSTTRGKTSVAAQRDLKEPKSARTRETATERESYWDVMDMLAHLPRPTRGGWEQPRIKSAREAVPITAAPLRSARSLAALAAPNDWALRRHAEKVRVEALEAFDAAVRMHAAELSDGGRPHRPPRERAQTSPCHSQHSARALGGSSLLSAPYTPQARYVPAVYTPAVYTPASPHANVTSSDELASSAIHHVHAADRQRVRGLHLEDSRGSASSR